MDDHKTQFPDLDDEETFNSILSTAMNNQKKIENSGYEDVKGGLLPSDIIQFGMQEGIRVLNVTHEQDSGAVLAYDFLVEESGVINHYELLYDQKEEEHYWELIKITWADGEEDVLWEPDPELDVTSMVSSEILTDESTLISKKITPMPE